MYDSKDREIENLQTKVKMQQARIRQLTTALDQTKNDSPTIVFINEQSHEYEEYKSRGPRANKRFIYPSCDENYNFTG